MNHLTDDTNTEEDVNENVISVLSGVEQQQNLSKFNLPKSSQKITAEQEYQLSLLMPHFPSPITLQPPTVEIDHQLTSYREINSNISTSFQTPKFDHIVQQLSSSPTDFKNKIKITFENLLHLFGPFQNDQPNVHEIGTISCGIGMRTSDLHFVVQLPGIVSAPKMADALENVHSSFEEAFNRKIPRQLFTNKSNRGQTKMPTLQLRLRDLLNSQQTEDANRKVTISINQMTGLTQRALIRFLCRYDKRFPELCMTFLDFVTDFIESESLSSNFLSSRYAFTLMVVNFLQVASILPSIERIQSTGHDLGYASIQYDTIRDDDGELIQFDDFDKFDADVMKMYIGPSANTKTTQQLLDGLLGSYAQFRSDEEVVCPRKGKRNISRAELLQDRMDKFPRTHCEFRQYTSICIEDPVVIKHNLGFGPELAKMFQGKMRELFQENVKQKQIDKYICCIFRIPICVNPEKVCFAHKSEAHFQVFTDGSKRRHAVGGAFVVLVNDRLVHSHHFRLSNGCSVFQSEILSIRIALIWCMSQSESCVIITDSEDALKAIVDQNNEHQLAVEIRKLLRMNREHICLRWIKAHIGQKGNEMADFMAKEATTRVHVSYVYSRKEERFVDVQ